MTGLNLPMLRPRPRRSRWSRAAWRRVARGRAGWSAPTAATAATGGLLTAVLAGVLLLRFGPPLVRYAKMRRM